jgi:hypothetical protein
MVPQPQAAGPEAGSRAAPIAASPPRPKRWPLFLSIFGAIVVSLMLWSLIILAAVSVFGWLAGPPSAG